MFFVPSVPLWVAKLSPLPQELIWVNFRFNDLNKPLKMVINEINTICNLQCSRHFETLGANRAGKGGG